MNMTFSKNTLLKYLIHADHKFTPNSYSRFAFGPVTQKGKTDFDGIIFKKPQILSRCIYILYFLPTKLLDEYNSRINRKCEFLASSEIRLVELSMLSNNEH